MSTCLDYLGQYALQISASSDAPNATADMKWPTPQLFALPNCPGLPLAFSPSSIVEQKNPSGTSLGSFWVPPGWSVTLLSNDATPLSKTITSKGSTTFNSTALLLFDDGKTSVQNRVATVRFTPPPDPSAQLTAFNQWVLQRCLGERYDMIGATTLTSFQPGSSACDNFMNTYCKQNPDVDECACLKDEANLRNLYCGPGNTNPGCDSNAWTSAAPVTCLGKNCSYGGYRWARMLNQKCNVTLCQQLVSLIGDDLVIQGSSELWCGNRALSIDVSPTPSVPTDEDESSASLPTWLWFTIVMTIFFLLVIFPVAVILLKRIWPVTNASESSELTQ